MSDSKDILEQAQVFASAWSLVGGPFDDGTFIDTANAEKKCLADMVSELEAARAIDRAEIERLKNELVAALAACEMKDSALRNIADDQHAEENRYVFLTAKQTLTIRPDSKALDEVKAQASKEMQVTQCDYTINIHADDRKETYCSCDQMMRERKALRATVIEETSAQLRADGLAHATGFYLLERMNAIASELRNIEIMSAQSNIEVLHIVLALEQTAQEGITK